MNPRIVYHWSPTERRQSINRYGLVPGKLSTDRLWRPPVVCLAADPWYAWLLSGATPRGREVKEWDLWQIYTDDISGWEVIPNDDGSAREYRVYERIYKRNVKYLGSRVNGQ